jgi:hypothetical protein
MFSLSLDNSKAPCDAVDLVQDLEQYSVSNSYSCINPKYQRTLSVSPYGSRIMHT